MTTTMTNTETAVWNAMGRAAEAENGFEEVRNFLAALLDQGFVIIPEFVPESLGSVPLSYVYRSQVQEAAQEIAKALDAMSDQSIVTDPDAHRKAAQHINVARQRIDNVYKLAAEGILS